MNPIPEDLQSRTLRACTTLHALRPRWPGALILNLGLHPSGAALSLAANVVGAACLSIEPDPQLLRSAQRTGACDFVVTTLDEALRALKNEIRKQLPLSVALHSAAAPALDQILARGLAPQLLSGLAPYPAAAARLQAFGAEILPENPVVAPGGLELHTFAQPTPVALRDFDARALALLAPEDALRRRWLLAAPRLFPRDRTRTLWLTPAEARTLASSTPKPPQAAEPTGS
ncbi:MAG: hypothetical protein M3O02_03540 [Acidobacteriota bacterium]|nr:hypothetical protein [Acidobacteriota bacterium]